MAIEEKTGRDFARKIALPVILVISIIVARLIINFRSAIILSAPVELSRCGLTVSMPLGNGWQSDNKWIFDNDGFVLRSVLSIDAAAQSYAQCQYLLATEPVTAKERFDKQAANFEGQVVQTGQMQIDQLIVEWAKIIPARPDVAREETLNHDERPAQSKVVGKSAAYEMVFGICPLAAGRHLEIEVLTQESEEGLAWEIFERIANNIRFSDNGLLQAGAEVVNETTSGGIKDILPDSTTQDNRLVRFFIVSNSRGRPIGFTLDVITGENQAGIKAAHYYYMKVPIPNEEVELFTGDAAFEQFTWKVESRSRIVSKGIEMTGKNGSLTVRHESGRPFGFAPGQRSDQNSPKSQGEENEYVLGSASVPNIVLEPVLRKLLAGDRQEIIVDVIMPNGTIAPIYIEKINAPATRPGKPMSEAQSIVSALRLEILDGRGFWQQVYYDDKLEPLKMTVRQENTLTLQRATENQVAEAFPERADLVRNRTQLLDEVGL